MDFRTNEAESLRVENVARQSAGTGVSHVIFPAGTSPIDPEGFASGTPSVIDRQAFGGMPDSDHAIGSALSAMVIDLSGTRKGPQDVQCGYPAPQSRGLRL